MYFLFSEIHCKPRKQIQLIYLQMSFQPNLFAHQTNAYEWD